MREFLEGPPAGARGAGAVTAGAGAASSLLCYAPLFAAAGAEDPRALDDTQLQHLGVQKIFHRKRILRWARVLQISSGSEPAEADAPCAVVHVSPLAVTSWCGAKSGAKSKSLCQ